MTSREDLIKEAAKAMRRTGELGYRRPDGSVLAEAALAVFEKAHAPTDDECRHEACEIDSSGNSIRCADCGASFPEPQGEPSDAPTVPVSELQGDGDAPSGVRGEPSDEHDRDGMGICRHCGHGVTARDVLDGEKPCVASSTATRDALIEGAKLDARNSMRSDPRVWHEALEAALDKVLPSFWGAALRAAGVVGQEGEKRG